MDDFKKADKFLEYKQKQLEKELIRNYQMSLKEIRLQLSILFEKTNGDYTEALKFNRLANLEVSIQEEIRKLTNKNAKALIKGLGEQYAESYYYTAFILEKSTQVKLGFSLLDPKVIRASLDNPLDRYGKGIQKDSLGFLMRHTDSQTVLAKQVKEKVTQGLIQGKGYAVTARQMKERIDVGASSAMRIVQTESHRVQQSGRFDSLVHAENKGVKIKKRWISTLDGRTRDSHASLDGETIDIDDYFESNGNRALYPSMFGVPEEDINCRCSTIAIFEGLEPGVRRARGEGIIPYTNYEDWKKGRL